jgi:hypothetical protein
MLKYIVSNEIIRFILECIVNSINGNVEGIRKHMLIPYLKLLSQLLCHLGKKHRKFHRSVISSKQGVQLINIIFPFIFRKFC